MRFKKLKLVASLGLVSLFAIGCTKEKKYDMTSDKIYVGLECNYQPFNWTETTNVSGSVKIDGSNEYCAGYDIRIASRIATEMGKSLIIKAMEWDGLIPGLKSNVIDLVIAGMTPTKDRKKSISFSDTYYKSEQVIVVKSSSKYANATTLTDFASAILIAQEDTLQDDLIDEIPNVTHGTALKDYPTLIEHVKKGTADGFVAEYPVAAVAIANDPNLKVIQFSNVNDRAIFTDVEVSIGARKVDKELLEKVNEVLAKITEEERNAWMLEEIAQAIN